MSEDRIFDVEEAIKQSKEFIQGFCTDVLLHDPETGEDLFLVSAPVLNDDGTLTILCAANEEPDHYIHHTLISSYVSKDEIVFGTKEDIEAEKVEASKIITNPNSGKLVGLDGQFLN